MVFTFFGYLVFTFLMTSCILIQGLHLSEPNSIKVTLDFTSVLQDDRIIKSSSDILIIVFFIFCSLVLSIQYSVLSLRSSVFSLRSSVFRLPSSVFSLPSSVFGLQSSVFGLPSSVFCRLPSFSNSSDKKQKNHVIFHL